MIAKFLYQSIVWKGLLQLSVFILNLSIARHFEAATSGHFFYLINIYALLLLVASLSLESGIIYFGVKNKIDKVKLLNFSIGYSVFITVILWVFFTSMVPAVTGIKYNHLAILFATSFICGNLLSSYSTSFFNAEKNFVWPNIIAIIINVLLIIFVPYKKFSLVSSIEDSNYFNLYFSSFFVMGIVLVAVYYTRYIKKNAFAFPSRTEIKKLLSYSLVAWTANIIFFLLYRIDYFFVEKYCSAQDLGNYIQVSKIGQLFFLLPTIAASVVFPITAANDQQSIFKGLAIMSRLFFSIYIIICLVIIITGKWFFPFLFGGSYTNMYPAFIYLVPGILALSVLYSITAYNAGVNKIATNIKGTLVALVVIIGGNVLFITNYSINIAAFVSSLGYIALLIYLMYNFKKQYNIMLSDFFIFKITDIELLINFLKNKKIKSG